MAIGAGCSVLAAGLLWLTADQTPSRSDRASSGAGRSSTTTAVPAEQVTTTSLRATPSTSQPVAPQDSASLEPASFNDADRAAQFIGFDHTGIEVRVPQEFRSEGALPLAVSAGAPPRTGASFTGPGTVDFTITLDDLGDPETASRALEGAFGSDTGVLSASATPAGVPIYDRQVDPMGVYSSATRVGRFIVQVYSDTVDVAVLHDIALATALAAEQ
jgi:hypothetical protein